METQPQRRERQTHRTRESFPQPIEQAMRQVDNGKVPARVTMLDQFASRFYTEAPASFTLDLEKQLMPPIEAKRFKAALVKAAFTSFTVASSTLEKLAVSKGFDTAKIVNEASYYLTFQLWAVRLVEVLGTHLSESERFADVPDDPVDTLYTKIAKQWNRFSRSRILPDNLGSEVWGKYCERSDQDRLKYPCRIGKTKEPNSFKCSVNENETADHQLVSKNIAEVLSATCQAYLEIAPDAAQSGQPIGYLNRDNSRSVWTESEKTIPIILTKKINGETRTFIVNYDPFKSQEEAINDLQSQIATALKNERWHKIQTQKKALIAYNIQTQDRVLSLGTSNDMNKLTNVQRPFCEIYEGVNDKGERCLEVNVNHTVIDGVTADVLINGGTRYTEANGRKEAVEYKGITTRLNDLHRSEENKKLVVEESYPPEGQVTYEMYPAYQNQHDVIISRELQEKAVGADILQTAVLFANDIYIKHMAKTRGGAWEEMCVGTNNTHVNKNNPLSRLIPASVYYIGPERYEGDPRCRGIEEALSVCRALQEYKHNKWLAENYETIKDKPEFREHAMPASAEAMAVITESNMMHNIQEFILFMQTSKLFNNVKHFITYPQTIVTDNGTENSAATHITVGNEALPGISQRQNGRKLEMVFSAGKNSIFVPPDQLELYAKFVAPLVAEFTSVMSRYQDSQLTNDKMTLEQLNQELKSLRQSNSKKLPDLETEINSKRALTFLKSKPGRN